MELQDKSGVRETESHAAQKPKVQSAQVGTLDLQIIIYLFTWGLGGTLKGWECIHFTTSQYFLNVLYWGQLLICFVFHDSHDFVAYL